ncbi:hypothetical protein [Metamycoplasma hyosynoviae]|uniref:hypothetical protein n=1 Tax=Metamycoplasma hyosynoviae TaxID=29559 RepID=UPI002358CDD8|nr:hypothetical protein [Metamycoplasma hyosynoviae]MDC8938133.1 hypothetical protein [Metamycoplasma hyosynoviae]
MNFKSASVTSFANIFALLSTSTVTFLDAVLSFLISSSCSAVSALKPSIEKLFAFDKTPLCLCFSLIVTLSLVLSLLSTFGFIENSKVFLSIVEVSVIFMSLATIVLAILSVWLSTVTSLIFSSSVAKRLFISSAGSALKPLIGKTFCALVPFLMFFNSTRTSSVVGSVVLTWCVWVAVNTDVR